MTVPLFVPRRTGSNTTPASIDASSVDELLAERPGKDAVARALHSLTLPLGPRVVAARA